MNVSVVIPVYNAAKFIESTVESVLVLKEVKEIILVEDASPDDSLKICYKLEKKHDIVKVFRHPGGVNKGEGESRNLGIKKATQEFISFLDADDFFTNNRYKIEKQIFDNNPECDGVYGAVGTEYVDEIGAKAWEAKGLNKKTLTTVSKPIKPEHLFEFLSGYNNAGNYNGYFSIIGVTLKRKSILESGIKFSALKLHTDTVFLWEYSYKMKLCTGDYENPIAVRRVHKDNQFIHHDNLNHSRFLMYKMLSKKWKKKKYDKKYKTFFYKETKNYLFRLHGHKALLYNLLKTLITIPEFISLLNKNDLKIILHRVIYG
jgi:glycosyltransferase involved in cell wall biosynthesis